jgi:hypothetical protein
LFARKNYTGRINGDALDVQFTVYGRTRIDYIMQGQLFDIPGGSRLEMFIRLKTTVLIILALALVVGLFILLSRRMNTPFLVVLILFLPLNLLVLAWHRNVAVNGLAKLLLGIVSPSIRS